jgi:hypothetical protein
LQIEKCLIKEFVLFPFEFLEGVIKHDLKIGLEEADHSFRRGVLVCLLYEVVETLSSH